MRSFFIHFSCWDGWGGNQYLLSWPNAAIPSPTGGILWDWSRGEKTDTSISTSLNSRRQKLAFASRRFFFPSFKCYFLEGTFILTLTIVQGDESQFHPILLLSNLWYADLALLLPLHGKQVLLEAKHTVF